MSRCRRVESVRTPLGLGPVLLLTWLYSGSDVLLSGAVVNDSVSLGNAAESGSDE
jgi:hypothetical protein